MPYHPEVGQTPDSATTYVLEFPVKAPSGSIFRDDLSAIQQLEYWKMVKENYTEHNPSVTISVGNDEWIDVANWVYKNWDMVGAYHSCRERTRSTNSLRTRRSMKRHTRSLPRLEHIDYSKIITYEKQNETDLKKELACATGVCEIV